MGDVSRARYLHQLNALIEEATATYPGDPMYHPAVRAKLAVFEKQFKLAESIYLEQGQVDEAMEMYQELHKWDESILIAEAKVSRILIPSKHDHGKYGLWFHFFTP